MRVSGLLHFLALVFVLITSWTLIHSYASFNMRTIRLPHWLGSVPKETCKYLHGTPFALDWQSCCHQGWSVSSPGVMNNKCGLSKPCPKNFFAFKIISGAANVVGPTICFEDHMIMSPVKDNVGRGLNIVLVNGTTGMTLRQGHFDMYSGDATLLLKFLKEIPEGMLMLVASFDDPGTKMNNEIRMLFSNLGSSYAKQLGFRDSWVFLGARDMQDKSPFEQFLKNNANTNKYEGWPELLELEGCVPQKVF
ncbi:protein FAM3D [Saccopteryx bilineata]|uniref:protein FAM3D n=1 Tax=Saccopteryx bilineata TaxID=59482 RepID=UPI00338DEFDF